MLATSTVSFPPSSLVAELQIWRELWGVVEVCLDLRTKYFLDLYTDRNNAC